MWKFLAMSECVCLGYDLLLRFVFGAFNRKYLMVLFLEAALSCDSFVYVRVLCVCVRVFAVECCVFLAYLFVQPETT